MPSQSPAHYLLFAQAQAGADRGSWRFVLAQVGASRRLAASDVETAACRERLELLAVVRGLEAIDEPARVTLVTGSRYVNRGIKRGLAEWRASGWQWERFGQLVPVRDSDLWRRVDHALAFHQLDCRFWRFESLTADSASPLVARRRAAAPRPQFRPISTSREANPSPRRRVALAAG